MNKSKTLLLLSFFLVVSGSAAGDQGRESHPTQATAPASAEVSLLTVEPAEIQLTNDPNQANPTVTVQIAHTPLASEQKVTLAVGTFRTDPPKGGSVSYDPATQIVRLPQGPQGKVDAKVTVRKTQLGSVPEAVVVIVATIKPASPGIKIDNDDPGLPNHQATLTIRNK